MRGTPGPAARPCELGSFSGSTGRPYTPAVPPDCPFCQPRRWIVENAGAVAFLDGFPVSPGHALITPRRHVADLFELAPEELASVWTLLPAVRAHVATLHRPDGFNVGVNVGAAAGQTVGHAHVHLIPRYQGDVADPRGGVRWILPAKADYWSRG